MSNQEISRPTEKELARQAAFGYSASNINNHDNPAYLLPGRLPYLMEFAQKEGMGLELQMEHDVNRPYEPLPEIPPVKLPFLGIHWPLTGVDLSHPDPQVVDQSLATLNQSTDVAIALRADYIVAHPLTSSDWDSLHMRQERIERAKANIITAVEYARAQGYEGEILFENLEFPLYPATMAEILEARQWIKEVENQTGVRTNMVFDIGHLWHSGLLIAENNWRQEIKDHIDEFSNGSVIFVDYAASLLREIKDVLRLIHVAGAKITPAAHDTHLPPVLDFGRLYDDRNELDVTAIMIILKRALRDRKERLLVVNETHQGSYQSRTHASQSLERFLIGSLEEPVLRSRERITNEEAYHNDPRVVRSILEFWGGEGESWEDIDTIKHAFIGVGTESKARRGKSPVSSVSPDSVGYMIQENQGKVELHASLLPKESTDRPGEPERVLLIWDVDRFRMVPDNHGGHNYDVATPLLTPEDTFKITEPLVELYTQIFAYYGIPVIATMTGKGLHFVSQVTDPEVLNKVMLIGGIVEDTIAGKLKVAPQFTKHNKPISPSFQLAHVGAARLQQFVNSQIIREARRYMEPDHSVEIFNKAHPGRMADGLSLDNFNAAFPVYYKNMSALGSVYFLKPLTAGVSLPHYPIQLPFIGEGFRYQWQDVYPFRYSYQKAAEFLGTVDTHIPDAGTLERLIEEYERSGLKRLHSAMDSSMGDLPGDFAYGYRKDGYDAVLKRTAEPDVNRNTVRHAPSFLGGRSLLFYYLDKLVFQVFHSMGGNKDNLSVAPHTAGFLRAVLEDPNLGWGNTWTGKMDAALYARKITEQVLGQMFEEE
ncbi:MAG: TIM barrel protein [Patescibacteria group bacterium]